MVWEGFKDIRATIEIDLKKQENELWDALDKDARWGVNKAKRENLAIKEEFSSEDATKFYEIYKKTCLFGGINPAKLSEINEKNPKFFFCYKDNKIIAGCAIIIENEKRFRLFLNASDHEYTKYQPNNLLYWYLIIWGKKNNFEIFDLGGYQIDAKPGDKLYNVNKFKGRWGGKIRNYNVYSKNPIYVIGRKLIRKSRFLKWIWDRIKARPIYKNDETQKSKT